MNREYTSGKRPGDCKSLMREFDSHPRLQKIYDKITPDFILARFKYSIGLVSFPVAVKRGSKGALSLSFEYCNMEFSVPLNCTMSELTDEDIDSLVTSTIRKHDGVKTIMEVLVEIKDDPEFGGNDDTRKKNFQGITWFAKRTDLDLDQSTKTLLNVNQEGFTLPEQWEKFDRPHKLRHVVSIFSRKNLKILKRRGHDITHFASFATYIAPSSESTPFTTSDAEVEHIINFMNKAREDHPVFYDIYLLAFGAGLRQGEIYQLKYEHFKVFNGQYFIELPFLTKRNKLKGNTHVEKVGISKQVFTHFHERYLTGNVVNGGARLHKRFIAFLKVDVGISENKACHRLRKILGARLATTHGIFHASKTLRNSVVVCEKYYSDLTSHNNDLVV